MKLSMRKECLRAEIFKNLAYFLASIFGIALIKVLIYKEDPLYYFSFVGIIISSSLLASVHFIGISIEILEDLDKEIYKKYIGKMKQTKEERKQWTNL